MKTCFFAIAFLFFCHSINGQIEVYPQVGISYDNLIFPEGRLLDMWLVDRFKRQNVLLGLTIKSPFDNGLSLSLNSNTNAFKQNRRLACVFCTVAGTLYSFHFRRYNISLELGYKFQNLSLSIGPRSSFLTNYKTDFSNFSNNNLEKRKLGSRTIGYLVGVSYEENNWLVAFKYSHSQFTKNNFYFEIERDSYLELSCQYKFQLFGKNKGTEITNHQHSRL